jgi:hypothetical protein
MNIHLIGTFSKHYRAGAPGMAAKALLIFAIAMAPVAGLAQIGPCNASGSTTQFRNDWISFNLPSDWQVVAGPPSAQSELLSVKPQSLSSAGAPCELQIALLKGISVANLEQDAAAMMKAVQKSRPGIVQTAQAQRFTIGNVPAVWLPFVATKDRGLMSGGMAVAAVPGPNALLFIETVDQDAVGSSAAVLSPIIASVRLPGSDANRPVPGMPSQPSSRYILAQAQVRQESVAGCAVSSIAGGWSGHKISDVGWHELNASFTFHPDGTYEYSVAEGTAVFISEQGSFQIAAGNNRYPCKITLTPDQNTVRVSGPAQLLVVQSADLMDDKPRTFYYKFWDSPSRVNFAGTWTDWRNDIGSFGLDRE